MDMHDIDREIKLLERQLSQLESSEEYEAVMDLMDKIYQLEIKRDELSYQTPEE